MKNWEKYGVEVMTTIYFLSITVVQVVLTLDAWKRNFLFSMSWEKAPSSTGRWMEKTLSTVILVELNIEGKESKHENFMEIGYPPQLDPRRWISSIYMNNSWQNWIYLVSLEFTYPWIFLNSSLLCSKHSMWHFSDLYLEYTLLLVNQFVVSPILTMSLMSCW